MSVLSFRCFSLILVFKKGAIERILTLPYSYKLQKFKKNKLKKKPGASEYVAERTNSLILLLDLRRFYWLMIAPSRKLQYAVV